MTEHEIGKTAGFHLNGVSYRQLRSRKNSVRLNHGEPVPEAVKKILVQLLVLILIIVLIFSALYGKFLLINKLTDDSYLSLSMSSKFRTPVSLSGLKTATAESSTGYAVLECLSGWAGTPVTQSQLTSSEGGTNGADSPDGMLKLMEKNLPGCQIEFRKNLSNYDFLSEIYRNLAMGNAVVVPMAIPADVLDKESYSMTYGILSSADFSAGNVNVLTPYGRYDTLSLNDFISSTRFLSYETSLREKLGFLLGVYSINSFYTISKAP